MKKIGLVGGMSWQSTILYYKYINNYIKKNIGGLNSAEIIISSINFYNLEKLQRFKKWKESESIIYHEIKNLIKCEVDLIGICSNTGNECAERIKNKIKQPIINIADPIGEYATYKKMKRVGLIGTIHTMEENYIKNILQNKYNIKVFIPNKNDRIYINNVIYQELCLSIINKKSKDHYLTIMNKLVKKYKLEGFILGCTEIPLLIKQEDINIALINSTKLHAEYLAKKSIQK